MDDKVSSVNSPFSCFNRLKSTDQLVKSPFSSQWNQVKSSEFQKKYPQNLRWIREIHRNPGQKFPQNPPRYHPRSPVPLGSRSATQKSTKPMGSCWLTWAKNNGENGAFMGKSMGKWWIYWDLFNYFFEFMINHWDLMTHMLHGAGIFTYKTGCFLGQMLVNIPWSIWDDAPWEET